MVLSAADLFRTTLLLSQYSALPRQLYSDDPCITDLGIGGVCQPLQSCLVAQQGLRSGIRPTTCSFDQTQKYPIVCCVKNYEIDNDHWSSTQQPSTTLQLTTINPTLTTSKLPLFSDTNTNSKSEKMCREYQIAKRLRNRIQGRFRRDGQRRAMCGGVELPDIVGGKPAQLQEFPHMALLGYGSEKDPAWYCGGSLISERFVLTAAHCLSSREKGPVNVIRLGDLEISNSRDGAQSQIIRVEKRIAHPEYRLPGRYNDIALLQLARDAVFDGFTSPACLHQSKVLPGPADKFKLIATGWGRVGYTEDTSDTLLKVDLSPIEHRMCNQTYKNEATTSKLRRGIDDESMLCAGELKGGKDTCQGDSGGPLQFARRGSHCTYSIVGVTSFGKFCGFSSSPAVYTRVSHYVKWIEDIVWKD